MGQQLVDCVLLVERNYFSNLSLLFQNAFQIPAKTKKPVIY